MAKKQPTSKKQSTKAKRNAPKTSRSAKVEVKTFAQVKTTVNRSFEYNLHKRFETRLSTKNQKKIVSYAPWLSALLIIVVLPELMVFAKDSTLMGINGFFSLIFFNQASWVIMLILLTNVLLFVDGLSYLFDQKKIGWERMYQATLLSGAYVAYQLLANLSAPAAPLLCLLAVGMIIFVLLDIKHYYK